MRAHAPIRMLASAGELYVRLQFRLAQIPRACAPHQARMPIHPHLAALRCLCRRALQASSVPGGSDFIHTPVHLLTLVSTHPPNQPINQPTALCPSIHLISQVTNQPPCAHPYTHPSIHPPTHLPTLHSRLQESALKHANGAVELARELIQVWGIVALAIFVLNWEGTHSKGGS
eukprot:352968-Chlamydomonas_euryale.AAC.4